MTALNTGTYGSKIQSWKKTNPREILMRVVGQNPTAHEAGIAELFWDLVKEDEDCLKVIAIDYWLPNNYRSLVRPAARLSPQARTAQVKKIKAAINQRVHDEARILLLDMIMPNGKPLRECTGKEIKRFDGWLAKVAAKVKPNEKVGAVLSEEQVRKLYAR